MDLHIILSNPFGKRLSFPISPPLKSFFFDLAVRLYRVKSAYPQ